jgi:hypothetical protein
MKAAMFHDSAICGQPVLIHRKFEQRATELVRIAEIRGLSARVVAMLGGGGSVATKAAARG